MHPKKSVFVKFKKLEMLETDDVCRTDVDGKAMGTLMFDYQVQDFDVVSIRIARRTGECEHGGQATATFSNL